MSGRYEASDRGIYIRTEEDPPPRVGIAIRSVRHALSAVQTAAGRAAAIFAENHSTEAAAIWVRGDTGPLLQMDRWTGSAWATVLTVDNEGALDAADLTIAGAPVSGNSPIADQRILGNISGGAAVPSALTQAQARTFLAYGNLATATTLPVAYGIACSDETTALTTGNGKATFRLPHAMTLTAVRASLTTASSSGLVTVDINEGGTTVLSTALTIDQDEKTSTTATPAVISDASLADDAEIRIDIDGAGTNATGLKVWLIGTRAVP